MAPAEGSESNAAAASKSVLLQPYELGPFKLSNRIVLAPLTRCRALGGIPQPALATYYVQRAHGNLLLSEATIISDRASG